MGIMPAGVHHTRLPGFERNIACFLDGKRVHIGSDRNDSARPAAAQQSDYTVLRNTGPHLEAETSQAVGDDTRRTLLSI
jgi:hypothetical protein